MRVGILGSGLMGGKLGRVLARAGHEVVFSYARSKAKLQRLASASCLHANLDGKRPTRSCAVGVSPESGSVRLKIPATTRLHSPRTSHVDRQQQRDLASRFAGWVPPNCVIVSSIWGAVLTCSFSLRI